jgi:DNA-binding response OmpR family regulator
MNDILKNITLLYAEDDLDVQKQMVEYFETFFKQIYVVSDGKEALELYKKHQPELLILDIYMPNLDGLALAEYIRQNDYKTKLVVLSAHSQAELMLKAINSSVNYYIIKPATLQKIKDMLNKISEEFVRDSEKVIRFDEHIYFNLFSKKLYNRQVEINLSKKERDLLELLAKNINKSTSIEDIIVFVWSDSINEVSLESVKSLMSKLRKKLPKDTISNVYGVGYIMQAK